MNEDSIDYSIVLTTIDTKEAAIAIANSLLSAKLAACINIFPVESLYTWQGKINRDSEWQLIIKTRLDLVTELTTQINSLHGYEIPEIITIPILDGSPSYLHWLNDSLK